MKEAIKLTPITAMKVQRGDQVLILNPETGDDELCVVESHDRHGDRIYFTTMDSPGLKDGDHGDYIYEDHFRHMRDNTSKMGFAVMSRETIADLLINLQYRIG